MDRINKTKDILNYLALGNGLYGVSEIGRALSLKKEDVFRILSSMENIGWAVKDTKSKKYSLGNDIVELSALIFSNMKLTKVSLPFLYEISHLTGETSSISLRIGLERIFLQEIPGRNELHRTVPLGQRFPLWISSAGKSMLAFLTDDEIEEVMDHLKKAGTIILTSGNAININQLRTELKEIRKNGFSVTSQERVIGICSVSAPIFDDEHQVVACLSISGQMPRVNLDTVKKFIPVVQNTANRISYEMGRCNF